MISNVSLAKEPQRDIFTDQSHQLDCLTEAVYHEARGESVEGQAAVARVVLNRARYPSAFGDSICSVVYKRNQFSWSAHESLVWGRHDGDEVFAIIRLRCLAWMLADTMDIRYVPQEISEATFFSHGRPRAHHLHFAGMIGHHHFYYNNNYLASSPAR